MGRKVSKFDSQSRQNDYRTFLPYRGEAFHINPKWF